MGLTVLEIDVANPANPKITKPVKFLIDSGAMYSVVPTPILEGLGIKPIAEQSIPLADGSKIIRKKGVASFKYKDHVGSDDVIFGKKGDGKLLGASTLKALGLISDSLKCDLEFQSIKPILFISGFLYGVLLSFLVVMIEAPEGSGGVVLAVFLSPLELIELFIEWIHMPQFLVDNVVRYVGFIGAPPILWSLIFGLLGCSAKRLANKCIIALLSVHYLAIPVALLIGDVDFSKFFHVCQEAPTILLAAFSIYFLGHALIWIIMYKRLRRGRRPLGEV
jgi:predicted aspartyl protease